MPKASFLVEENLPVPNENVVEMPIAYVTDGPALISLEDIEFDAVTDVRSAREGGDSIAEFAEKLKAEGLAQPPLVRPDHTRPGVYKIIAGRRRVLASRVNDPKGYIQALVRDVDDATARKLAFEENYRRKQFSAIDLARLFLEARGETYTPNWSERVSKQFGVSRATVTEHVKLYEGLAGDQELIAMVHSGEMAADAAGILAKARGEQRTAQLAEAQRLADDEEERKKARKPAGKGKKAVTPAETPGEPASEPAAGKKQASKPAKVKAKHVKAAARASGQPTGSALGRTELLEDLAMLVDPGYPAVLNAFLNYLIGEHAAGRANGNAREILKQHWRAVASEIEDKPISPTGRLGKSSPALQNIPDPKRKLGKPAHRIPVKKAKPAVRKPVVKKAVKKTGKK